MSAVVHRFLTHDGDRPLTFGVVVDRRAEGALRAADSIGAYAGIANNHPGACAFGKISVIARDGIHTFQACADGRTLPVFCGNSTAAALVALGGEGQIESIVHGLGKAPCLVSADLTGTAAAQTWTVPDPASCEIAWHGLPVILMHAFNDYAIVIGDLPEGCSPEAARHELLGTCEDKKLAVIGATGDGGTLVRFYNANGLHGAAPHTGLATIALAARKCGWFDAMLAAEPLHYQTAGGPRRAHLPRIEAVADGRVTVHFPAIAVKFDPLVTDAAA